MSVDGYLRFQSNEIVQIENTMAIHHSAEKRKRGRIQCSDSEKAKYERDYRDKQKKKIIELEVIIREKEEIDHCSTHSHTTNPIDR